MLYEVITKSEIIKILFLKDVRITSYNVCYTKLLRLQLSMLFEVVLYIEIGYCKMYFPITERCISRYNLAGIKEFWIYAAFVKSVADYKSWNTLRITSYNVCYTKLLRVVKGNNFLKTEEVYYADPEIFDILTFDFISGSPRNFASDINSVFVSESALKKYFPENKPGDVV